MCEREILPLALNKIFKANWEGAGNNIRNFGLTGEYKKGCVVFDEVLPNKFFFLVPNLAHQPLTTA